MAQVNNPFENKIVGVANYLDFGFELQTRVDNNESSNGIQDSTFQVAASWQANKNFLLKGKMGPLGSSVALAFKSWWKPSLTFSISGIKDHVKGETTFGFGLCVDNIREASYQKSDPNFGVLTSKPVLQSDVNSENHNDIPEELRPLDKFF